MLAKLQALLASALSSLKAQLSAAILPSGVMEYIRLAIAAVLGAKLSFLVVPLTALAMDAIRALINLL